MALTTVTDVGESSGQFATPVQLAGPSSGLTHAALSQAKARPLDPQAGAACQPTRLSGESGANHRLYRSCYRKLNQETSYQGWKGSSSWSMRS